MHELKREAMTNPRSCAKCSGGQVVEVHGTRRLFGGGGFIRVGVFEIAAIDRLVCLECGYCEEWLSPSGLALLRKRHGYVDMERESWLLDEQRAEDD